MRLETSRLSAHMLILSLTVNSAKSLSTSHNCAVLVQKPGSNTRFFAPCHYQLIVILGTYFLGVRIKHMIYMLKLRLVLIPVWRQLTQLINHTRQHF